jgi:hypothetical protein
MDQEEISVGSFVHPSGQQKQGSYMSASGEACVQLEGLEDAPTFAAILNQRCISNISITSSRRLRRAWHARMNRFTDRRTVEVPALLDDAPRDIKDAIIDWALLLSRRKNESRDRRRELERKVFSYISLLGTQSRNRSNVDPCCFETLGNAYDLREVFDLVNMTYFGGTVVSFLLWGKHPLRSFQSVRLGPDGLKYNLITIAAMYNRPDVPRCAIEGILHHEMLHIACPPLRRNGRNVIHGREFKARERGFPGYGDWTTWEKRASKQFNRR